MQRSSGDKQQTRKSQGMPHWKAGRVEQHWQGKQQHGLHGTASGSPVKTPRETPQQALYRKQQMRLCVGQQGGNGRQQMESGSLTRLRHGQQPAGPQRGPASEHFGPLPAAKKSASETSLSSG